MTYQKTVWVDNSLPAIDAANLNHLEQGVFDAQRSIAKVAAPTGIAATDDANFAAAQASIVAAGGGIIELAAGTYAFATAKTIASFSGGTPSTTIQGITVRGAGRGVTVLSFAPASGLFLFNVGDNTAKSASNVVLQDFDILLANTTAAGGIALNDPTEFCTIQRVQCFGQDTTHGEGIRLSGQTSAVSGITIADCTFKTLQTGIRTSGYANGNLISDCWFGVVTYGIRAEAVSPDTLGGSDNMVARCEFNGSTTTGIYLRSGAAKWLFTKCNCDGPTTSVDIADGADGHCFVRCGIPTSTFAGSSARTTSLIHCGYYHDVPDYWFGDVELWRSSTKELTLDAGAGGNANLVVSGEARIGTAMRLMKSDGTTQFSLRYGSVTSTSFDIFRQGASASAVVIFSDDSINVGISGGKLGLYGVTTVVQPATTGTATGFTAGAGTAVKDDSTFTGGVGSTAYRISDVVKALKQIGAMAQ